MSWKYFTEEEMACKHCGKRGIDPIFMTLLEKAREIAGIPFVINSGYRCDEYDKQIGGEGNHNQGLASDITALSSQQRFRIVAALIRAGFNRLGIGKNFIHADICKDEDKPPTVMWLY